MRLSALKKARWSWAPMARSCSPRSSRRKATSLSPAREQHSTTTTRSVFDRRKRAHSAASRSTKATYEPLFGRVTTSPSWRRRTIASRTGVRPTPRRSRIAVGESRSPGAKRNSMMPRLSAPYASSACWSWSVLSGIRFSLWLVAFTSIVLTNWNVSYSEIATCLHFSRSPIIAAHLRKHKNSP